MMIQWTSSSTQALAMLQPTDRRVNSFMKRAEADISLGSEGEDTWSSTVRMNKTTWMTPNIAAPALRSLKRTARMTRPAKMSRTSASPVQHQSKMNTITCSNRISLITGGDILPLPCPSIIIIANLPSIKDKRKAKKLLRSSSRNLRNSNIAEDAIKGTISMMLKIPLLQKNPKLKIVRKIAKKTARRTPRVILLLMPQQLIQPHQPLQTLLLLLPINLEDVEDMQNTMTTRMIMITMTMRETDSNLITMVMRTITMTKTILKRCKILKITTMRSMT